MKPEFIALKYNGVPTVEGLKKDSKSYIWKCRKYSKWRLVHIEQGDAAKLHQMADSLDEGTVDCEVYGRMSEIWLRIQRWKLDKTNLQIEPPRKKSWEQLKVGIQVASAHPHSIVSYLYSRGIKEALNVYNGCVLYLLFLLSEFIQDIDPIPAGDLSVLVRNKEFSKDSLDGVVTDMVCKLYSIQCINSADNVKGIELLNLTLKDLEIDAFIPPEVLPYDGVVYDDEPSVFIDRSTFSADKVVQIRMIKGKTIVTLNEGHASLQNIMEMSGQDATEIIFSALGAAANDMTAKEDVLNDFLALFSLHLTQLSTGKVN